MDFQDLLD